MLENKYCPRCGSQSPNDALFCSKCGASFQAAPSQPAYPVSAAVPTPVRAKKSNPLGCGCLVVILIVAGLAFLGRNSTTTPDSHTYDSGGSKQQTNYVPAPKPHIVFKESGSGIHTTEKFQVSDDWDLVWAYNCADFDNSGNFIVMINKDGSDFSGEAGVNELGEKGDGTEHLHGGAGTRYLTINSECNWTIEAMSQ